MACLAIKRTVLAAHSENSDNVQFKMFGDKQRREYKDSLELNTGASSEITES